MKSTVLAGLSLALDQLCCPSGRPNGAGDERDLTVPALLVQAMIPLACDDQFLKLPEFEQSPMPRYEPLRDRHRGMPANVSERRPTVSGHGRRGRD